MNRNNLPYNTLSRISRLTTAVLVAALFCSGNGEAAPPTTDTVMRVWAPGFRAFAGGPGNETGAKDDWRVRKKLLLEYGERVSEQNEVSLKGLRNGEGEAAQAIGRGKAALVFHDLRRLVGEAVFSRIAQTLATGAPVESWNDVRSLFENETRSDLGWFFAQWVDRKGLPDLRVENALVRRTGGRFEVSFDLLQEGEIYVLNVPVSIADLHGGSVSHGVKIDDDRLHVVLLVDEEPAVLKVDGEYDVPRKLVDAEVRPKKRTGKTEQGIVAPLRDAPVAIDMSALKTLAGIIDKAAEKKIVYVGEYHDRFAHHQVELEVIRALYRKDQKLSIGMEMFQRPFQKALDEYISGTIDEREFLRRTEYFERWSYDYNLYKPIVDFARAEKIPVVALNIRNEITEKVSKSGMDALTEKEKTELPGELDFSDTEYRDRLKQAFEEHKARPERSFDFFYKAQVVWDESMAQSIDEYLKKNSGRRMVVVAGMGHLFYGSGIPQRTFRRNGYPYATVLNDAELEQGIGDYLVFPQSLDGVSAPKLMASLKETGNGVEVVDLSDDSVSKAAGMQTGDTILALDNESVKSVADIRLALFYKQKGERVKARLLRKRFILGDKELELEVKL